MKDKSNIIYLAGAKDESIFSSVPFEIYRSNIIDFLSEISTQILSIAKSNNKYRIFSYYALWSRRANLYKLRDSRDDLNNRFGRGIAFHIAPSNVSSNILFTMAFGLLSGCPSIVRVSPNNIKEIEEIIKIIDNLLHKSEYKKIKNYLSIISYERNEEINNKLSFLADLRIIWGGNDTINYFKGFKTKPKSIDIVFPNRTSISIISLNWLKNASEYEKSLKAKLFSNDIALFSQKACSSPKQLIIIDPNLDLKNSYDFLNSFLKDCDLHISLMNELEEFHTLNNLKSSCELAANIHEDFNTIKLANIFGLYSNEKNELFNDFEFENCCFLIRHIKEIHEINNFLKDNNQTIVEIGLSQSERDILIEIASPLGTDRIVGAGKALNMDIFWDGYDTVGIMSRYVQYSQNG